MPRDYMLQQRKANLERQGTEQNDRPFQRRLGGKEVNKRASGYSPFQRMPQPAQPKRPPLTAAPMPAPSVTGSGGGTNVGFQPLPSSAPSPGNPDMQQEAQRRRAIAEQQFQAMMQKQQQQAEQRINGMNSGSNPTPMIAVPGGINPYNRSIQPMPQMRQRQFQPSLANQNPVF